MLSDMGGAQLLAGAPAMIAAPFKVDVFIAEVVKGKRTGKGMIEKNNHGGRFNMYKPKPIDTSGVELSGDITGLIELLAENAHDNWALKRINEGWTYGPKRDDAAKKHPDLVPYTDLPETEKEYDRKMAIETVKLILASGYRIQKG